ncbi:Undecaprenyl-phosphate galactose phosphotransferase, WbaP/exopolysaccharide biosynthesis polyprenyl glycosylphosphotransferase [Geodermatophilus saharensis]|uniref:Undecaprenyl-phosphate galactose phosphotransferase, WbaP/exopolysaccharide biosynthesis polyprenyl glycosylphosphotransferase n=1 Tax=Geodermatophilus saharensis TaxID=1137994 RepID=A0A239IBZ3_9ACTN|nr:sugar transferase [Geodermatophilus saharensis]SNS90583.1 Undecaprenyl-phosphate galactose phosphotransferase, WbaP/exopolysaccharide biosynthesis polyprenyl glycosylphosphotransferase [Geodermatophilus saharensis]
MSLLEVGDGRVRHDPTPVGRRWLWLAPGLRGEGTAVRRAWRASYVRRLVVLDALAAFVAAAVGSLVPEGGPLVGLSASAAVVLALPVVWLGAMLAARAYEQRYLWVGPEEFRRVFSAAALLLATVGTVSWAFKLEVARSFVVVALPLATLLTLATRLVLRLRLYSGRAHGRHVQTTVLVGHRSGVAALSAQLEREARHGYRVIGCCLPLSAGDRDVFDGLPVLGSLDEVADVVRRFEVDTVAVLPSPELEGARLRKLGWDLEDTEAELLLAPAVTEVAGPRVHVRPVAGLPLVHVERPEFTGARRIVKDVVDRTAAGLGILLLSPLLVALALLVKVTSSGPVFFRHERIGRDGRPFQVLKFRSMVVDADKAETDLHGRSEGNAVQFKMRRDPRVTRIGAVMRRYSLDELPQLFNVLGGSMSLVGPRPHVTREVEQYGFDMRRRLLVKPGITGLWQVSGRSDLSWDDAVRLDVHYVENWSLTFDAMILWKTAGAVLRGSGAY